MDDRLSQYITCVICGLIVGVGLGYILAITGM